MPATRAARINARLDQTLLPLLPSSLSRPPVPRTDVYVYLFGIRL